MSVTKTLGPCVCVQKHRRKTTVANGTQSKSQDGGLCINSHTLDIADECTSSSIVASQSASSSRVETTQSASRVLALCELVDNA